MIEYFLRKTIFKTLNKEGQNLAMLLKDKIIIDFISNIAILFFGVSPLASFITLLIACEHTLDNIIVCIIFILSYFIFLIYFIKTFNQQITIFIKLVSAKIYSSRYVIKGNAISREDFEIMKKENEQLHYCIMTQQVKSYCYSICFHILTCLKKGTIQFVAIRRVKDNNDECDKDYSMHVLYVNNDWCFDTYSQRQYPYHVVMEKMQGKIYRSFNYEDIEGKTHSEFNDEIDSELTAWCEANNCIKWIED